ncbi:MAG TPA: hypothetical protein VFH08_19265 [Chitinophagaceae bacterium]|nr:hypothetical protein [Chitinophagaceae bacterium]
MKKIISALLVILSCSTVSSQQTQPVPQPNKQDYLQKSKEQKTAAWLLLGGGAALTVGGSMLFAENFDIFSTGTSSGEAGGAIMMIAGVGAMGGSIPLFIASARNKGRADEAPLAIVLKMEKGADIRIQGITKNYYPALSLKMMLR